MFKKSKILKNFIVFEGIDGSGKTTQADMLRDYLKHINKDVIFTQEPTARTMSGNMVRAFYKNEFENNEEGQKRMAKLLSIDRREHVKKIIENKSTEDSTIICDRYLFSSLAYQSQNYSMKKVWKVNKDFPLPKVVIYLDTCVYEAENRIQERSERLTAFENRDFLKKVKNKYKKIFKKLQKNSDVRFFSIDTTDKTKEQVSLEVISIYKKIFLNE